MATSLLYLGLNLSGFF